MATILLVSPQVQKWRVFAQTLAIRTGAEIEMAENSVAAMDCVEHTRPWAVVVAEQLEDCSGVQVVREILSFNAMTHIAMASDLSRQAFHAKTEGLGVLMQLPFIPRVDEALSLAKRLGEIAGIA